VLDLELIFSRVTGAPLKINAFKCFVAEYSEAGLAATPAKAQQKSIVVRVVWIYPTFRQARSIKHYLPVGTIKFPIEPDGQIGKGHFERPYYRNGLFWRLGECVSAEHRADAWKILSDVGKNEILTLCKSKQAGGHPRTKQHARKIQFIAEHRELWDAPRELVRLLLENGFFSRKSNLASLVSQVESHIARMKAAAANDSATL